MRLRPIQCAVLAVATVAGCAGRLPPTHYYTLHAGPRAIEAVTAAEGLRVGVETFDVDPPYDQDRLVYRASPDSPEVGFYAYHRWAAPLGSLVAHGLASGLAGTPGIATIEPAAAGGDYTARLTGRVAQVEEVDRPGSAEVRFAISLRLEDAAGERLWSASLATTSSGPAADAGDVMRLAQQAFGELVARARRDLAAALAAAG